MDTLRPLRDDESFYQFELERVLHFFQFSLVFR